MIKYGSQQEIHSAPTLQTEINFSDAKLIIDDSLYLFSKQAEPMSLYRKFMNATSHGLAPYAFQRVYLSIKDQIIKLWNKLRKGESDGSLFKANEYYFELDFSKPSGTALLYNDRNTIIGKLLWANDRYVSTGTILSCDSMSFFINQLMQKEQLLALFSASFYQSSGLPEGFFSHHKQVLNPKFNPHWDALVIIDNETVRVANLITGEIITTPAPLIENQTVRTLPDFHFIPDESESTAFQLPLLIFNNQMLIDVRTAAYRLREFRLLCKVSSPVNNDQFWILLNHEHPDYLPNAVYGLANTFNQQKMMISFAILLDVGANNYLQLFDKNNRPDRSFRGIIPLDHTNHVVYLKITKPIK
ncbi:MAG: hypothetical protein JXR22_01510 [Prolixibacteraceae bacterium]|nr:hypothetical protein [Prolixibacteraceae bacterium]